MQRSLSRALASLGEPALPALARFLSHPDPAVRSHAIATERLIQHPDEGLAAAIAGANRIVALQGAPTIEE